MKKTKIFKYQHFRILSLTILLVMLYFWSKSNETFLSGSLWGIKTSVWFILAVLSPVVHQFYVLVCWRYELYYRSLSELFGKKAFSIYKAGFSFLILSRLITIIILAVSNAETINISSAASYTLSVILFIPAFYLFLSVRKYFGADRAFGYDHFHPEKAKNEPFVKKGIFKYTSNGMYVFGFLILWVPAILLKSQAALSVALFNHVYIWVHYYFTELPDMKEIYGKKYNNN